MFNHDSLFLLICCMKLYLITGFFKEQWFFSTFELFFVYCQVCKDVYYDRSLFERSMHLPFEKKMLMKQYMMHPSLSQFLSEYFYENKIVDASIVSSYDYNNQFEDVQLPVCAFFDTSYVEESSYKGSGFVESATIMFLLHKLCAGILC